MFCYCVVHYWKIVPMLIHVFPIRGHSFLPNDTDFHLIGGKKYCTLADTPDDWDQVSKSARKFPTPFTLVKPDVADFKNYRDFFLILQKGQMSVEHIVA